MKTNLDRTIKTVDDAKEFLTELHGNNEVFHPEDDAHSIEWAMPRKQWPTPEDCDKLNTLTDAMYSIEGNDVFTGFDPCRFLIDLDHSGKLFLLKDKSGATSKKTYTDFMYNLTIEELEAGAENGKETLADFLHNGRIGGTFEIDSETSVTRTK